MKFTINKNNLSEVLLKSSKTIPTRSTLPILSCALFEVVENSLIIKTTNLEIYYSERVDITLSEPGKIAIPIHKLIEITTAINDKEITITVSDIGKVTLDTNSGKYTIMGQTPDEFPSDPVINDAKTIQVEAKTVNNIIKSTIYAASKDDMKPVLQGVFFLFEKDQITAVATDGSKLVKTTTNINTTYSGSIVVPVKFLTTINNLIEGKVEIYVGENHIQTATETTTVSSRIIKEKYPDYEKVIPTENPHRLKVDKQTLIDSVKRVSIFSNKTTKQIALTISKEEITVTTEDAENITSAIEKTPCNYSGETTTIGYNANFLIEVLKQQQNATCEILLKNPLSAAVFKDETKEVKTTTLLMPIRLSD